MNNPIEFVKQSYKEDVKQRLTEDEIFEEFQTIKEKVFKQTQRGKSVSLEDQVLFESLGDLVEVGSNPFWVALSGPRESALGPQKLVVVSTSRP